jgi:hypothetical protein
MRVPFSGGGRLARLALLGVGCAAALAGALIVLPWLRVPSIQNALRARAIAFLIALEVAGWLVLVASLFGTVACGALVHATRRRGMSRPWAARGLLLSVSCLFALALAEGASAAWTMWSGRFEGAAANDPVLPRQFSDPKDDAQATVVVMGESSAVGVPYEAWLSLGRIVVWQLQQAIVGRHFRLEVLAESGDTLETQHQKLAGLRVRPDVLIVYSGHNEFISRMSWYREVDHYLDDKPPSAAREFLQRMGRGSSFCRLIRHAADRLGIGLAPAVYRGHRPLVDVPAYTKAELDARRADFRRRLDTIVAYAEEIGALPVLIVSPSNDAGFDPSRSFLPADTSRAEREAFQQAYTRARRHEKPDGERALAEYRALVAWQPGFADAHYRLAQLLDRRDAREEAYQHFVAARDCDGLAMRCMSSFQQACRDVAAAHDCILVDGQALFHGIGPRGLLDDTLFHDSVHPTLAGHIALAQAVLDALHARGALGWPAGAPVPRIKPADCAAHFGMKPSDWLRLCERGAMFYNAVAILRHDASQRRAKQRAYVAAAQRIKAGAPPESVDLPNVGVKGEALPTPSSALVGGRFPGAGSR